MEKAESTAQLDICEGAEYDFETSRFEAHRSRRRCGFHCSKRTQLVTLVLFVFFVLIVMGILVAMFGPGSPDLEYKTAKLEGSGEQDKKTEPPSLNTDKTQSPTESRTQTPATTESQNESTAATTQAPPVTCANTRTQGPTTPAVAPDLSCDVAIVGGGIAGLYVAKVLTSINRTSKVCVFEKNKRLGGRIYDHHFDSPNASVGLGAWGIEINSQPYIGYLIQDLKIETQTGWDSVYLHRSRGITVAKGNDGDLCDVLKAKVYPSLRQRKLTNETCLNLVIRVTKDETTNTADFATAGTYLSNYLTSEGTKLIAEYYGVKSDYLHLVKPAGYIDFLLGRRDELDNPGEYIRPTRGMSAFIKVLEKNMLDQGGHLFPDNAVSTINQRGDTFHLQTTKQLVSASKVVLAVPPLSLAKIKGGVTEKVTQDAIFESIVSVPAFKGAALYRDAWWNDTLQPLNTFISYDDCLGVTMPHEARGGNGEAILYTVYANGACAKKWGVLEEESAGAVDKAVQRALEEKFNNNSIPTPLKTIYKYWEDGLHFQKAGSNYTNEQLFRWARRPVEGHDVFLVGDAYYNYGYLCEHALKSAIKALVEGWNVTDPTG